MIDRYQIQKLRDLPIEGVAQRLGLDVRHHRSLCPFHDDRHPSLTFDVRHNRYRCFVCGEHGGNVDLVMKILGMKFQEACRWLADGTNVIIEEERKYAHPLSKDKDENTFDSVRYQRYFQYPWLSEAANRFLFMERRLDARVIHWCRVTSWRDKGGTNWLQTPYYDVEGKLIGIQNRNLDYRKGTSTEESPRFRFPRGSCCSIYNLPILKMLHTGDSLFITEGCSDCWAMLSSGHKAIAIPSATLLKASGVKLLEEWNDKLKITFHMFPDQDEPGERLFLQLRDALPNLTRHQLPPGCKDFSDYYMAQKKVVQKT